MRAFFTTSLGAAACLVMAGFPIDGAEMGDRGRVRFLFAPEAGSVFREYQRANAEVHAALDRVRERRGEQPDGRES